MRAGGSESASTALARAEVKLWGALILTLRFLQAVQLVCMMVLTELLDAERPPFELARPLLRVLLDLPVQAASSDDRDLAALGMVCS